MTTFSQLVTSKMFGKISYGIQRRYFFESNRKILVCYLFSFKCPIPFSFRLKACGLEVLC